MEVHISFAMPPLRAENPLLLAGTNLLLLSWLVGEKCHQMWAKYQHPDALRSFIMSL